MAGYLSGLPPLISSGIRTAPDPFDLTPLISSSYYPGNEDCHELRTASRVVDARMLEIIADMLWKMGELAHEPFDPRPQLLFVIG